jgi:hypothetical protein
MLEILLIISIAYNAIQHRDIIKQKQDYECLVDEHNRIVGEYEREISYL